MSLLREIQTEATSEAASTANLLRKAQVLAARLDYEPLGQWVKHELDGYYGEDAPDLPEYRQLGKVQVLGHFQGGFGAEMRNVPIAEHSIDEDLREPLFTHDFRGGVAELEASLAGDAASEHPGTLTVAWPTDAVAVYAQRMYEGMVCRSAWKVIPAAALAGVLDAVRSKLLAFALEIERIDPNAGEAALGDPKIDAQTVSQVFNTNIYGSQNVVAAGGHEVTQIQSLELKIDWSEVSDQLRDFGLSEEDVDSLREALSRDADQIAAGQLGPATEGWLGKIAAGAAGGSVALAEGVTADVIAHFVLKAIGAE